MTEWKSLEEIPDSDDEAFDSQHLLVERDSAASGLDVIAAVESQAGHEYQQEYGPSATKSNESSPLSSLHSEPDITNFHDLTPTRPPNQRLELTPQATDDNNAPNLPNALPPPTEQGSHQTLAKQLLQDTNGESALVWESVLERRLENQYQRSLRPRKPIQEHPYLLEKTHYSNILRSHGVQPVKAAQSRERAKAASSDGEESFDEGTQSSTELPHQEDGEIGNGDNWHQDAFAMFSSSPAISRATTQNATHASQHDTEDADLPTLQELVLQAKNSSSRSAPISPDSAARKRRRLDLIHSDSVDVESKQFGKTGLKLLADAGIKKLPKTPISSQELIHHSIDYQQDTLVTSSNRRSDEGSRQSHSENVEIDSLSTSESELHSDRQRLGNIGKRIRGVLPASWIRLDQHASKEKPQPKERQRRDYFKKSNHESRRGVAQVRMSTTLSSTDSLWPPDSSDEEPDGNYKSFAVGSTKSRATDGNYEASGAVIQLTSSDESGSAMEDDKIDSMFHRGTQSNRRKRVCKPRGERNTLTQGFKLSTQHQDDLHRLHSTHQRSHAKMGRPRRFGREVRRKPVSHLSVLDVIEPDAPKFLRIAARTARKRHDQGRTRRATKSIVLADQGDQKDVISVLKAWDSGAIHPRASVSVRTKANSVPRQGQHPRQQRISFAIPTSTTGRSAPRRMPVARKLAKSVSVNGSISYVSTRQNAAEDGYRSTFLSSARPAQMEEETASRQRRLEFHAKKKCLDLMYKSRNVGASAHPNGFSEAIFDRQIQGNKFGQHTATELARNKDAMMNRRRRLRKQAKPQRVDTTAPRFYNITEQELREPHSGEPLSTGAEATNLNEFGTKLLGLGTFGKQFHLFEDILPLPPGVYFHDSTPLGQGLVNVAATIVQRIHLPCDSTCSVFRIGEQCFSWSVWNEEMSSQLGILLDVAAEYVRDEPSRAAAPIRLLCSYILTQLRLDDNEHTVSFFTKLKGSLRALQINLATSRTNILNTAISPICSLLDSLLLIAFAMVSLFRDLPTLIREQIQSEELLKDISRLAMSILIDIGFESLQKSFSMLRDQSFREKGLRNDMAPIHTWTLLLKVLQRASIMRGSFWDIASIAMVPADLTTSLSVDGYERVWKQLFILIPLTEFDDNGILVQDSRFFIAADGWQIPQKLLKRIFDIYNADELQPANFNKYCHVLLTRCHRLIQDWGWCNSSPIVGTIFDFFGARNLEHLRHEDCFRSPQFLEDLAGTPSLHVQPSDKCFHIFLKFLALSIKMLWKGGCSKDVRNLIARTIPNHDRQHLKTSAVHERDLAALRNHHDLLCTLFWAAPRDLRPQVTLIEHLVSPASSHKEACLINVRAWSQLAGYVVSHGEASASFKPLLHWQKSFMQSLLQELNSVTADIQQQLSSFPRNVALTFSSEVVDTMIRANKRAIGDVLMVMTNCSLSVMKKAPDLEAAMFCLNIPMVQRIFSLFLVPSPDVDWRILHDSLSILGAFLDLIDFSIASEDSQPTASQLIDTGLGDEALLLLDHDVSRSLFNTTRSLICRYTDVETTSSDIGHRSCTEHAVGITTRMIHRFASGGLISLSAIFQPSTYGIFTNNPLMFGERQYLVLFIAKLLASGLQDFSGLPNSLLEIWLLSLVTPEKNYKFQMHLYRSMQQNRQSFVPDSSDMKQRHMDYRLAAKLFEYALAAMRSKLSHSSQTEKRSLLAEYGKTLKSIMDHMKRDLTELATQSSGHVPYVIYVRNIISIIRAHGAEMCTIDDFYYQMTKEYSPSLHDPQLQVAGMVSYGLRLKDGDPRAEQQLFFFLLNNAKQSIIRDKIGDEVNLLRRGLCDGQTSIFILGSLFPAIVRACFQDASSYPLLDIYTQALGGTFGSGTIAIGIMESELPGINAMFSTICHVLAQFQSHQKPLEVRCVHIIGQSVAAMNILWPSLIELSSNGSSSPMWASLMETVEDMNATFSESAIYVESMLSMEIYELAAGRLFESLESSASEPANQTLSDYIVQDIRRSWATFDGRVTIQVAAKTNAPQQGTRAPDFQPRQAVSQLLGELRQWLCFQEMLQGRTAAYAPGTTDLIF